MLYKSESNSDIIKLSNILNISHAHLDKIIYRNKNKKEYFLKRHISTSIYMEVSKLSNSYIYFINENKRSYLGGRLSQM